MVRVVAKKVAESSKVRLLVDNGMGKKGRHNNYNYNNTMS